MANALNAAVKSRKPIRIKPSRKGGLHTALGVPLGQKIPASKVAAAANSSNPDLRKKANFARNAASWS